MARNENNGDNHDHDHGDRAFDLKMEDDVEDEEARDELEDLPKRKPKPRSRPATQGCVAASYESHNSSTRRLFTSPNAKRRHPHNPERSLVHKGSSMAEPLPRSGYWFPIPNPQKLKPLSKENKTNFPPLPSPHHI
jgi:hypothetical protein